MSAAGITGRSGHSFWPTVSATVGPTWFNRIKIPIKWREFVNLSVQNVYQPKTENPLAKATLVKSLYLSPSHFDSILLSLLAYSTLIQFQLKVNLIANQIQISPLARCCLPSFAKRGLMAHSSLSATRRNQVSETVILHFTLINAVLYKTDCENHTTALP